MWRASARFTDGDNDYLSTPVAVDDAGAAR
jgi:hypothetical protein